MKIFDKDFFRYFVLFSEIGITMFLNIFLAIYFYNLFEKYFFKSFIFLIFMVILGIFNVFYILYNFFIF